MQSIVCVFIFFYLAGRLLFYDMQNILTGRVRRHYALRIIFGLSGFLFFENIFVATLIFLLHAITVLADTFLTSRNSNRQSYFYMVHLVIAFLLSQVFLLFNFDLFYLFNPLMFVLIPLRMSINSLHQLFDPKHFPTFVTVLTGFIFTIKEGTIIIRLILRKVSAVPKKKEAPRSDDKQEFERGKLIGILERGLIYFLIIFNQVAAIAIIIALKSLARFKELEDKQFAEYFLIGSLTSICVAMVPAVVVRLVLNGF